MVLPSTTEVSTTEQSDRLAKQESSPRIIRQSGRAPIGVGVADDELVARMRKEDVWAKEAFYRKHVDQAHRVAFRLVKNRHDAEDVVQEAFAQGFRDLPKLREPALARSWLMRIVVNRAHRRFRKRKVLCYFGFEHKDEPVFEPRATSASPEAQAELALLEGLLEGVPLKLKTAWVLRYVEGCTLPEVAEMTECSLATTKRRIKAVNDLLGDHTEIPTEGLA